MSGKTASKEQLRAKAAGIFTGCNALPKEALVKMPTVDFARDYNTLRSAMETSFADIKPLLPPLIDLESIGINRGPELAKETTYGEILSFVTQIVNLLEDEEPENDEPDDANAP